MLCPQDLSHREARDRVARGCGQGALRQFFRPSDTGRYRIGYQVEGARGEFDGKPALGSDRVRIELQRALEQQNLRCAILPRGRPQPGGPPPEIVIAGTRCLDLPRSFDIDQFEVKRHGCPAGDLVLQGKKIAGFTDKPLRP